MIVDINDLYTGGADLYKSFSADRDFDRQVNILIDLGGFNVRTDINFLELFAGPAEHSKAFLRTGRGKAFAIDASSQMADLARSDCIKNFEYEISNLPEFPKCFDGVKFDIILAARYSVGYLDIGKLHLLMEVCLRSLSDGGILVFELHSPDIVFNAMRDLDIQTRDFVTFDGLPGCVKWPYGPIEMEWSGWVANFKVNISRHIGNNFITSNYISREHLHTHDLASFLATLFENVEIISTSTLDVQFSDAIVFACKYKI
ncbi:class I SAM-dependent methyltransferase [Pseudomonas syringae]|uniref:class I SAM-dependent methyltransferase n=1 Tax=Pseudomonas syringae TaxID=317 RepID=UPI001F16191E|nr:class I SAM-dependent methyltransferase [Pseudomonas syringae]MBL3827779.1 class I SAM-dependent methyltransferase [Pseudomonas syringae pv. theae]MBL3833015.1 class I SAM-dependent methyltransferase [Pseudomonas syringae pv. theae]MBL3865596.1 class I SAM-dependent methyltransferase [Pseudomonas syringae pv. theae]GKQ44020.1 hypothetical protein PSTH2693_02710 [Pseudomonas syringae pv. theae]